MNKKISLEQAKELLKEHFNIEAEEIKELDGYYDQNFYVFNQGKEFVFKRTFVDTFESLDFQNKMMEHLENKRFPVPKVINSLKEEKITKVDEAFIRLLTFLPGKSVVSEDYSPELLVNVGKLSAEIDLALQDFNHPAAHRKNYMWDLQNVLLIREYLNSVEEEKRKVVEERLNLFEKEIVPIKEQLRAGITHNDENEFNVLSNDGKEITALIDYGDASYTQYVNNLAIAMAHFMLRQENPLEKSKIVHQAYNKIFPLTEIEEKTLPILVMSRLTTLIIMSSHTGANDPGNNYVKQQVELAWRILQVMLKYSQEDLLKVWKS